MLIKLRTTRPAVTLMAVCMASSVSFAESNALDNWPAWRGPMDTGVAVTGNPPVEWSETRNIKWKSKIPGLGHSTPIVWDNHLFLTTAIPTGEALTPKFSGRPGAHNNLPVTHRHEFVVIAIDRRNGQQLWRRTVAKELPSEGAHESGSLASNSPVTDGKHVYAYFGSRGLYCFDFAGNLVWQTDFGDMSTKHGHGEGSSPVLHGDTIVITWDHEGQSFVAALDKRTGKQRWRVDREEVTSWATPIVVVHEGRSLVIVPGTGKLRAYDLSSGEVVWECGGLSANIVASPVHANGVVVVGSSYVRRAMLAVKLDGAKGDVTDSPNVLWKRWQRTPYVPSLLLVGDWVYFLMHYQGVLSRVNLVTGKEPTGPIRLGPIRNVYASPVSVGGRIYITDLDGTTLVLTDDPEPKVLAVNRLDESFSASMAIVGDQLFLRGREFLYCISE